MKSKSGAKNKGKQTAQIEAMANPVVKWFEAVINEDLNTIDKLLGQKFDISTPFPNMLADPMLAPLKPQMQTAFISMMSAHQEMRAATHSEIRDSFSNMQAIHIATYFSKTKSLEHLISKGLNMSAQCIGGLTALHIASQADGSKALQILLDNKVNLSVQSLDNAEPVHFAAQGRHVKNLRKLFDAGAYHDGILEQRTLLEPAYSKGGDTAKDLLQRECKKYFARAGDIATRLHTEGKYQEAVVHFKAALDNQGSVKSASLCASAASAPDVVGDAFSRGKLEALCAKNYHMLIIKDLAKPEELVSNKASEHYNVAIAFFKQALVHNNQDPEIYIALGKTFANYNRLKQKQMEHDVQDYISDAQPNFPCSAAALLGNELKFLSPCTSYGVFVRAVNALTKAESLRVSQESGELLQKYASERDQALLKIQTIKEQLTAKYIKLRDAFHDESHKAYCSELLSLIDKRFEEEVAIRSSEDFDLYKSLDDCLLSISSSFSLFEQGRVKKTDKAFRAIDKFFKKHMNQISPESIADPEEVGNMAFGINKFMLVWNVYRQETISRPDNAMQILQEALAHFQKAAEIDKIVQPQTPQPNSAFYLENVPKFLQVFEARIAEERAAATADDFAHGQELPDDAAWDMSQHEQTKANLEIDFEVAAAGVVKDL